MFDGNRDYSLGTVRGGSGGRENAVELNFSEDGEEDEAVSSEDTASEEYDEETWEIFGKEFDALMGELS